MLLCIVHKNLACYILQIRVMSYALPIVYSAFLIVTYYRA